MAGSEDEHGEMAYGPPLPPVPAGPDPVAEAAQIAASLELFAGIQAAYYLALRAKGFTAKQAMDLLHQWTEARIAGEDLEEEQ